MSLFEFIVAMLSIIVALGTAEILGGLARSIRDHAKQGGSWLHVILVLAVLLGFLQAWWEAWSLRTLTEWTFPALLLMLAPSALLFLVAHLLFSRSGFEGSLKSHYFSQAPAIFCLIAAAAALSGAFPPLILGEAVASPQNGIALLVIAGCLVLVFTRRRELHYILVPLGFLLTLLDALDLPGFFGPPIPRRRLAAGSLLRFS